MPLKPMYGLTCIQECTFLLSTWAIHSTIYNLLVYIYFSSNSRVGSGSTFVATAVGILILSAENLREERPTMGCIVGKFEKRLKRNSSGFEILVSMAGGGM